MHCLILLCQLFSQNAFYIINLFITVTKIHIYKCKFSSKKPYSVFY